MTNRGLETVIFDPEEMLEILDLKSIAYYKIKQGILQQNLSKYYRCESADALCEHYNKLINTLKQERNINGWIPMMKGNICQTERF